MGKSKPAAPAAPDYAAAATAQGNANIAAGQQTASLNNPNIYSPYGNQIVSYDATGPNGAMQPTIRQSLTPAAQQALDAQQQVQMGQAQLGLQGLDMARGVLGQPFNYNGPEMQTSFGGYNPANGNLDLSGVAKMPVNAGMTGQQAILDRLNPTIKANDASYGQQLANQGLTAGGEAYDRAMNLHNQSNNDLYSQAALQGINLDMSANQQGFNQALQSGGFYNQAQAQNYNQGLGQAQFGNTAIQQLLQKQLGLYNQPLNQINALMSGSQIQAPQFQQYSGGGQIGAAPIANATTQAGQFAQDTYGQQMAGYNADMSALGSAVGGLAGMATAPFGGSTLQAGLGLFKSDMRLKSNIVRVGDHPLGVGIYEYDIDGHRERGVMAQEVEVVRPSAVITGPDGFKMVNYGALN